jgi:hypothetical protein
MEQIYSEAFSRASGWRKEHGVTGDGKRKRPNSYKMTLWLRPWHYMQVCNDAARAGVSVTKYLQEQLTDPRIKKFLPIRENLKLWKEEEQGTKSNENVTSLRSARLKRQATKMLAPKGVVVGEVLPPGKRYAFAKARRRAFGG